MKVFSSRYYVVLHNQEYPLISLYEIDLEVLVNRIVELDQEYYDTHHKKQHHVLEMDDLFLFFDLQDSYDEAITDMS